MVTKQIRVWAFDDSTGKLEPLEPLDRVKSESRLEDALVKSPDVLMDNFSVVARQYSSANSRSRMDLVGVDEEGRLTVIELKRGAANRDAIAQILDYGSYLEYESESELAQHLSDRSGNLGTVKIEDFPRWYEEKTDGLPLNESRPVRLVVVGVGEDEAAARIIRFLSENGVDISMVYFQAFEHSGETLVARQVTVEPPEQPMSAALIRGERERDRRTSLLEQVDALEDSLPGIRKIWDSAVAGFEAMFTEASFRPMRMMVDGRKGLKAHNVRAVSWPNRLNFQILGRRHSAAAIEIDDLRKEFRVIFFGAYADLCKDDFEQAATEWKAAGLDLDTWDPFRQVYGYGNDGPVEFPRADDDPAKYCPEVKFCLSTLEQWEEHKDTFTGLARNVFRQAQITPVSELHLRSRL